MAVEWYVRGESDLDGVNLLVGVEVRQEDDVDEMMNSTRRLTQTLLAKHGGNHVLLVLEAQGWVDEHYPGRSFFIETDEDGKGTQVFDPRGWLKRRCDCPCRVNKR